MFGYRKLQNSCPIGVCLSGTLAGDTHCPGELARCYARTLRTTRRTGGTWTNTGALQSTAQVTHPGLAVGVGVGVGFGVGVGVGVCVGVAVGVGVGVGVGCTMESMES